MSIRFRKTIKILPGVKINIGKTGISTSVGVRGAHVTIGKRGTNVTAGLPGSGLSVTKKIGGKSEKPAAKEEAKPADGSSAVCVVSAFVLFFFIGFWAIPAAVVIAFVYSFMKKKK